MLPFAQSEIRTARSSFLRGGFQNEAKAGEPIVGDDLMAAVLAGGYPEALRRKTLSRRQDWYADYIQAIVQCDVGDVAQIEQIAQESRETAIFPRSRSATPCVELRPRPLGNPYFVSPLRFRARLRRPGEHYCLLPAHSDIEILSVIVGRVLDLNPFPLTGANDPNALAVADIEATAEFDRA
ncbi:ATP-binding protein [Rhizobium ruizarguesonis]|uniref:hypothetical protein n=1 Tax=Rhizobium ruizarguesonis TaxID=2081791 RepID=UPI001FE20E4E|nr:hypothetical protein [Rhizobium ruizarguesonis]